MNSQNKTVQKTGMDRKRPEPKTPGRYIAATAGIVGVIGVLGYTYFRNDKLARVEAHYEKQILELKTSVTETTERADKAEKDLAAAKYAPGNGTCEFLKGEPQGRKQTVKDANGNPKEVDSDCGLVGDTNYQESNEGNKASLSYSNIDKLCQLSTTPVQAHWAFADVPELGDTGVRVRKAAWVIFSGDKDVINSTDALGVVGRKVKYNKDGDNRTEQSAIYTVWLGCPVMFGQKKAEAPKKLPDKPVEPVEAKTPKEPEVKPEPPAPTGGPCPGNAVKSEARKTASTAVKRCLKAAQEQSGESGAVRVTIGVTLTGEGAVKVNSVSAAGKLISCGISFPASNFVMPTSGSCVTSIQVDVEP